MALINPCFKDQKLVSFEGEQTVEREREEEEEEEEKKIKQTKVWMLGFWYGTLDFVWITWNCKLYMLKCLSPNLGF